MKSPENVLKHAEELRWQLPQNLHDRIAESIHGEVARIAERSIISRGGDRRLAWQQNLDRIFQKAGAHGKQALTMAMGLGCNAAGVVATRIIDSPRERLIVIITNNFSLCNGR